MYDEKQETNVREQNNDRRNYLILTKNKREYDILKAQFRSDLKEGKNVSAIFNKMIRTIDGIPTDMPAEIMKRALDMAGLAAVSKAPYIYSAMSRALTRAANRCMSNGKLDSNCITKIENAIESCDKRIAGSNDPAIKTGLQTLRTSLSNIRSRAKAGGAQLQQQVSIQQNSSEIIEFDEIDVKELSETIDMVLEHAASLGVVIGSENGLIIQENLRSTVRTAANKVTQGSKMVANKVNTVGNTIVDAKTKYDIRVARQEVMAGKKPLSFYLKIATATVASSVGIMPDWGFTVLALHLLRRSKIKKRERTKLLNELLTEMEIINEKIKDAESDNDRQKKYAYIRLRREIQRAVDQIRYGEKFNVTRMPMKL